ncbi:MAG: DinB family protein [Phycisphaerae bacterium]
MASAKSVILGQLQTGEYLMEKFTADLTDDEYFTKPLEGANHTAWILLHLACSEDWAVSKIQGTGPRIEASMHELVKGGSPCQADRSGYPARRKIDELFRDTRAATVEAIKMFDEARWDDPAPDDYPKDFFPTIGSLWGMQATHQFWHIGQLCVCRAAMKKKPVLF